MCFNSRSRMGSDLVVRAAVWVVCSFNSRSRMGSDGLLPVSWTNKLSFNSRSRMGSDFPPLNRGAVYLLFQFTLPHGERHLRDRRREDFMLFQVTLPHGERQEAVERPGVALASFNSRSRMGSDGEGEE